MKNDQIFKVIFQKPSAQFCLWQTIHHYVNLNIKIEVSVVS